MSSKHSRQSPTPSTPGSAHNNGSKLPKFLQKQVNRDRSKSVTDPGAGGSPSGSSIASGSSISTPESSSSKRSKSKFLSSKDTRRNKDDETRLMDEERGDELLTPTPDGGDETPVIVEPISVPRPRTRSERPLSTASDIHPTASLYASTSSNSSRIGDLPTRLSGWFSHTFSTSSTDLSLPALISQTQSMSASPKTKGSALLTAAKYGKGHINKAMRHIFDSDATPDDCPDPIWLLGVQHQGYEPPQLIMNSLSSSTASAPPRSSSDRRRGSSPSLRSSISSIPAPIELTQSQSSIGGKHPGSFWPPIFYADFTSRIWLTYRSQFTPIRDVQLCDLTDDPNPENVQPSSPPSKVWSWVGRGEKGWTSDSGWGCMLRTGQSLLANALLHLNLGRDWRRPPHPVATADYATYVQILTWFFDTPLLDAPFSVHRMALAGKDLGKDVGQWFGPSTAAGAIKTLVSAFPGAALGVSVGVDGVIFQSDVYAASNSGTLPKRHARSNWGDRAVLVLVGIRLGLDGVNPIYYDSIKFLYTWPQSVGIAGGRPSSSYYFVGTQADSLFYLDPHHARPAVPLRRYSPYDEQVDWEGEQDSDRERDHGDRKARLTGPNPNHARIPTSPSSVRTGSSTFSYHAPLSPSPLQKQYSSASSSSHSQSSSSSGYPGGHSISSSPPMTSSLATSRTPRAMRPASVGQQVSPDASAEMDPSEFGFTTGSGESLDPVQLHYVTAYSEAELNTFHCDRVRKMPLSGLDPSMLLGFLCKDEADWIDLRRRVGELAKDYRAIFSIQDEPPSWPSDSEMGLESISEPDDIDIDSEGEGEENEEEQFFDTRSETPSTSSASAKGGKRGKSEENDTEDEPVDPITPGPNSKFDLPDRPPGWADGSKDVADDYVKEEGAFDDDIEDDWVDPSISSPQSQPSSLPRASPMSPSPVSDPGPSFQRPFEPPPAISSTKSSGKKKKSRKGETPVPVPIPMPSALPFPVTQRSPDDVGQPEERSRTNSIRTAGGKPQRMHTARARDGGRTQSGGVKGILTDT